VMSVLLIMESPWKAESGVVGFTNVYNRQVKI